MKKNLNVGLGDAMRFAKAVKAEEASNEENNNDSLQQNNKTSFVAQEVSQAEPVEFVGLNIKVPKNHRLHWLIAAKKEGSNLTAVIAQALTERYGLPTDDK